MEEFETIGDENTRYQTLKSLTMHQKLMTELLSTFEETEDLDEDGCYYQDPVYVVTLDNEPIFYGTDEKAINNKIYRLLHAPRSSGTIYRLSKIDETTYEWSQLLDLIFFNIKLYSYKIKVIKTTRMCH
jgi:hypothetical protein